MEKSSKVYVRMDVHKESIDVTLAGELGAYRRWLSKLKLPEPAQQLAFEEYVAAIGVATARIERLTRAIETEVLTWRFEPAVAALQAMRGIQFVHAVTLVAEPGDLTRFGSARQLMDWMAPPRSLSGT